MAVESKPNYSCKPQLLRRRQRDALNRLPFQLPNYIYLIVHLLNHQQSSVVDTGIVVEQETCVRRIIMRPLWTAVKTARRRRCRRLALTIRCRSGTAACVVLMDFLVDYKRRLCCRLNGRDMQMWSARGVRRRIQGRDGYR